MSKITTRAVLHATSRTTGVTVEILVSEVRTREVVRIRQAAQWLCCHRVGVSRNRCGELFHRDHTTVMHALDQIDARLRAEGPGGPTRALLDQIWTEAKLYGRRRRKEGEVPRIATPIIVEQRPPSLSFVALMEHGSRAWYDANDQRWRYALKSLAQGREVPR